MPTREAAATLCFWAVQLCNCAVIQELVAQSEQHREQVQPGSPGTGEALVRQVAMTKPFTSSEIYPVTVFAACRESGRCHSASQGGHVGSLVTPIAGSF